MSGNRVLMFVGAHPDDESFGPGGTLATYAAAGVKVVYVCATRGEAGRAAARHVRGFATLGDARWAELAGAARALGLASVIPLGYRDSGMPGAADHAHPRALVRAPLDELTRAVVGAIRDARPQVVMTFDPIGGWHHPDHIAVHRATVAAVRAAGDARRFPDVGQPFGPARLYCWLPRRNTRRGADPRFHVHARIRLPRSAVARKHAAIVCHRSQLKGPLVLWRILGGLAACVAREDLFMRDYPIPDGDGAIERDLFAGTVV